MNFCFNVFCDVVMLRLKVFVTILFMQVFETTYNLFRSLQRTIEEKNFETQNLRNCLKMSEAEISNLRKKIQSKAYFPKVSTDEIHNILPMLTKNQLSLMTGEKLRVNWTNEEVATGFALSYFSRRGYNYLIHKLLIPQPSVRTLQEWAQNMSVKPGILKDSLVVLKGLRETLTEGESQVCH